MKRVTLLLDENALEAAKHALGEEDDSSAVNMALTQMSRHALAGFFGSDLWQGALADMREDRVAAESEEPPEKLVRIDLRTAEALVLFDLLFNLESQPHLPIRDHAQRATLKMIQCCLERTLTEPFLADYEGRLKAARNQVLARWGTPPA